MVLEREFPEDIRVAKEIETLQAAGHKVTLACYTMKGRVEKETLNKLKIVRKPISTFIHKTSVGALKFPFYFSFWKSFLKELLNKEQYDVVHVHDLPLVKVAVDLRKQYGFKLVLDLHENWPSLLDISAHTNTFLGKLLSSTKQWREYERKYVPQVDRLIVVAEEMKHRMVTGNVGIVNYSVVPNTIKLSTYTEVLPNKKNSTLSLFYAGGLNFHRGLHIVLEGLSKLDKTIDFELIVVGSGSYESELKELNNNLGLTDKVSFLGWKTQDEVYQYLVNCDIALIPHLRNEHTDNTSPNKIFQYMLAGKPVLSADCTYIKNILEETNAGLVYEDVSNDDFRKSLIKLIDNAELRNKLGENGKESILKKYNWDGTSQELLKLYQNI